MLRARPCVDRDVSSGPANVSNVDVVRALFEAFNEGRAADTLGMLSPHVIFEPMLRPGLSVYHGHDGARLLHDELRLAPGGGRAHFDEFIELPDGRVQVHGHQVLPDGSVGPKESPTVSVRDGLVTHIQGWSAADDL